MLLHAGCARRIRTDSIELLRDLSLRLPLEETCVCNADTDAIAAKQLHGLQWLPWKSRSGTL